MKIPMKKQFARFKTWIGYGEFKQYGDWEYRIDKVDDVKEADDIEIIGEPKDNIEDLLMVGDIVHYLNETKKLYGEVTIGSENSLNIVKRALNNSEIMITGIELHENRVKQVLGGNYETISNTNN